jgi:hypothetical protein
MCSIMLVVTTQWFRRSEPFSAMIAPRSTAGAFNVLDASTHQLDGLAAREVTVQYHPLRQAACKLTVPE